MALRRSSRAATRRSRCCSSAARCRPRARGARSPRPTRRGGARRARGLDLDARAAPLREERRERREISAPGRHEHFAGGRSRRRPVELDDERLEHRLCVALDDVLEVEPVAVDHLPVAQREDLHRRLAPVDRETDDVHLVPTASLVGRLALGQVPDREEPVAVPRRLLEALVRRRLAHPLLEFPLDRPCLPAQELDHAVDDLPVLVRRDRLDARRSSRSMWKSRHGMPGVPVGRGTLAGAGEDAVQDVERLADLFAFAYGPA